MTKIAIIEPNGEINAVRDPSNINLYTDRQILNGKLLVFIPDDTNINNLLKEKYWNFTQETFLDRPVKPGFYYHWENQEWTLNVSELRAELGRMRNLRLRAADWTQLPDVTLTPAKIQEWRDYRQALRDLPALYPDITHIDDVVWPTPPA